MTKKKLIIILVVVLAGGGYAAKTFLLPKGFTLNLADGRYATMTIGLVLAIGQTDGATAAGATTSPAGIGTLPEEPAVRAIITNVITNDSSPALLTASGRLGVQAAILKQIKTTTDVKVTGVMFTDLAVQ